MSLPFRATTVRVLLCAAGSLGLAACNAMLGIDEPHEMRDSSIRERPGTGGNGGDEEDEGDDFPPTGDEGEDAGPSKIAAPPYAWAAWPMPNPAAANASNPQSFSLQSPDMVVDGLTGLEWQQSTDDKRRSRDDASAYCEKLNVDGGGFRLPSRIELLSLVDFTQENPYYNPEAFPSAPKGKYWTSSRLAKNQANGWLVNFEFGTTLVLHEPISKEHFVRCVRTRSE